MGGGEEEPVLCGLEKGAGGFACARGEPAHVARNKVERVDLVEWVAGFAFALKHEGVAVWVIVTFPASVAVKDELAGIFKEGIFLGTAGGTEERRHQKAQDQQRGAHPSMVIEALPWCKPRSSIGFVAGL